MVKLPLETQEQKGEKRWNQKLCARMFQKIASWKKH